MNYKLRTQIARIVSFVRPRTVVRNIDISELLENTAARSAVERFNDLYYRSGAASETRWRGIPILKNPCDLWVMADLIVSLKPRVIIETGTHQGGSAVFFSDIAQLNSIRSCVVTIDFNPKWRINPESRGIFSLVGYSTDAKVFAQVENVVRERLLERDGPVLVFLDSDHGRENVFNELQLYSRLVTPGSYIVVEDTNINGHPSSPQNGPGPFEAVEDFLRTTTLFERDLSCERHLLTFNPGGWLRRREVKSDA